MLTQTTMAALNTLQPNKFIFSSGLYIEDTIPDVFLVPNDLCIQTSHGSHCRQDEIFVDRFRQYPNDGPGTLLLSSEKMGDVKLLVKDYFADVNIPAAERYNGLSGLNEDVVTRSKEVSHEILGEEIQSAFSYLQVGNVSQKGPSIWIRQDINTNKMVINAYNAVNWALEPFGAMPLGINTHAANPIVSNNTWITNKVVVSGGPNKYKGSVCIGAFPYTNTAGDNHSNTYRTDTNQRRTCDVGDARGGLRVSGNVKVKNVYGQIGHAAAMTKTSMGSLQAQVVVTSSNLQIVYKNKYGENNEVSGHTFAYIGSIGIENYSSGNALIGFFKFDHADTIEESELNCDIENEGEKQSSLAIFDFEKDANKSTSLTMYAAEKQSVDQNESGGLFATTNFLFCLRMRVPDGTTDNIGNLHITKNWGIEYKIGAPTDVTVKYSIMTYGLPN